MRMKITQTMMTMMTRRMTRTSHLILIAVQKTWTMKMMLKYLNPKCCAFNVIKCCAFNVLLLNVGDFFPE